MCVLQPFTKDELTIDKLLGREVPSPVEENAALEDLLGVSPMVDEAHYDRVMQKIAARRLEEAHGGAR